MSATGTFEEWYERLKATITDDVDPGDDPEDRKGDKVDRCVEEVMADGHDESTAFAICNASIKADLEPETRSDLLEMATAVKADDQSITGAFLDVATKAEVDLPTVCRKCEGGANRTRMVGSFMCPTCAEKSDAEAYADFDAESSDYELAPEEKADEDEFGVDVYRVAADPDDDTDYNGDLLGIAVDFPESDVYVDWRREAFPDQLEDPHVSIYGSIEDLVQATGNVVEQVETYEDRSDDLALEESDEKIRIDAKAQRGDVTLSYPPGGEGYSGDDPDVWTAFLDELVEAGGTVFEVRGGELHQYPEDHIESHDPHFDVVGLDLEEVESILEDHPEIEVTPDAAGHND